MLLKVGLSLPLYTVLIGINRLVDNIFHRQAHISREEVYAFVKLTSVPNTVNHAILDCSEASCCPCQSLFNSHLYLLLAIMRNQKRCSFYKKSLIGALCVPPWLQNTYLAEDSRSSIFLNSGDTFPYSWIQTCKGHIHHIPAPQKCAFSVVASPSGKTLFLPSRSRYSSCSCHSIDV